MSLEGRVVLVTGASRGIGAAIAEDLVAAGASFAVGYGNNEATAGEVANRISTAGREAVAVGGDVSDPEQVEAMTDAAEISLGPVDVLVSNAGFAPQQSLEEIPVED